MQKLVINVETSNNNTEASNTNTETSNTNAKIVTQIQKLLC